MSPEFKIKTKADIVCSVLNLMSKDDLNVNFLLLYAEDNNLKHDKETQFQINTLAHYLNNFASKIFEELAKE